MGLPASSEAREFFRCATRRHQEAETLRNAGFTTGAVYLAGYGIECMLKALILDAVPAAKRAEVISSFRGKAAHSYTWLRKQYHEVGGAPLPKDVARDFALVATWSTELRYSSKDLKPVEADEFLRSANMIRIWAEGRF